MVREQLIPEMGVQEKTASDAAAATSAAATAAHVQVATQMLLAAVTALSQRAIVALSSLFTLLTAGSAFYLWMIAMPEIDNTKIVGLTIYSCFILALNIFGRRK